MCLSTLSKSNLHLPWHIVDSRWKPETVILLVLGRSQKPILRLSSGLIVENSGKTISIIKMGLSVLCVIVSSSLLWVNDTSVISVYGCCSAQKRVIKSNIAIGH